MVGGVYSLIAPMTQSSSVAMVISVVIMNLRSDHGRSSPRTGQWRCHDARELGNQEQADQHTDKVPYRPQRLHERP